jgi:hypothetical protein
MIHHEQDPTTPAPGSAVNDHPTLTHGAVLAAIRAGDVATMREQARQAETVGTRSPRTFAGSRTRPASRRRRCTAST